MFETNSSSTHALVSDGDEEVGADMLESLVKDPTIWTIEGYDNDSCYSAQEKLNFFAGYIKHEWPEHFDWRLKRVTRVKTEVDQQRQWQTLCEVVKEQTGYNLHYPQGTTWHASGQCELDFESIVNDKEKLRQAIFNPNLQIRMIET